MYSASKISWFLRKIVRSKSKKYYERLVDDDDDNHEVAQPEPEPEPKTKTCTFEAPKGFVAVYVGKEAKRYHVPIKYLSLPTFNELLMKSQEHYLDTKIDGPIMISSCTTQTFDQLLKNAKRNSIQRILF